jgi:myo-inositol-1(or 4)-monophosphatase
MKKENCKLQIANLQFAICNLQFQTIAPSRTPREPSEMTKPELLVDYMNTAVEAAQRGAAVLEDWRRRFQVKEKARFDLVTEADLASQRTIHDFLLGRYPGYGFLGEEEKAGEGRPGPEAPPTWIVDPLDGTTNYVHDFPFYCVSIGLQMAGELVAGVVFEPARQEMFAAARGQGAWLNKQRLHTSSIDRLERALLSTGFPPDLRGQERMLEWWRHFSVRAQSLRRTGSTALNLVYIAAGRFDGYWAFDNHVWDVAGATVILREAGGVITNVDGSAYDPYTPDALASNGPLHAALLKEFRGGPNRNP